MQQHWMRMVVVVLVVVVVVVVLPHLFVTILRTSLG